MLFCSRRQRLVIPQDPESLAVRDVKQVARFVVESACDPGETKNGPRICGIAQVEYPYSPCRRRGIGCHRVAVRRFSESESATDHLQSASGGLIRPGHALNDVRLVRILNVNDRETF